MALENKTVLQTATGFQPRTTNAGDASMPLPKPNADETRADFVSRCMKDAATQDITGATAEEAQSRRLAACFRQWGDGKSAEDGEIETKALAPPTITNADEGQIEAVVATLGTIDRDRDVIPVDAFESGVKVKMSAYGHSSIADLMYRTGIPDQAPVGKGAIFVEGDQAVFRGHYFMDTIAGKEAFLTAKAMGPEQEWSFGYRTLKTEKPSEEMAAKGARRILAKLGPLEVSPVLYAGGVGTRTLATKAGGDENEPKAETASVDGVEHPASDFAYVPDEEKPSTWKFPIFDAAHVRNALARFDQADLPASDKAAVLARIHEAAKKFGIDVAAEKKQAEDAAIEAQRLAGEAEAKSKSEAEARHKDEQLTELAELRRRRYV